MKSNGALSGPPKGDPFECLVLPERSGGQARAAQRPVLPERSEGRTLPVTVCRPNRDLLGSPGNASGRQYGALVWLDNGASARFPSAVILKPKPAVSVENRTRRDWPFAGQHAPPRV